MVRFPDTVLEAMRRATDAVLRDLSAADGAFARALQSYRSFVDLGRDWAAMGEAVAARAILGPDWDARP